jgi:hypothetical protein
LANFSRFLPSSFYFIYLLFPFPKNLQIDTLQILAVPQYQGWLVPAIPHLHGRYGRSRGPRPQFQVCCLFAKSSGNFPSFPLFPPSFLFILRCTRASWSRKESLIFHHLSPYSHSPSPSLSVPLSPSLFILITFQKGKAPVLLRIEKKSGHGAGTPTTKVIEEVTDKYSFLIDTLHMDIKDNKWLNAK